MAPTGNREAHELLLIEEADAWFEYADATKGQLATRYAEIEPWAWARLQNRLRAIRARRARLAEAQAPETSQLGVAASAGASPGRGFPNTPPCRPPPKRARP